MKTCKDIKGIEYVLNKQIKHKYPKLLNLENAEKVRNFHMTIDEYKATPLVALEDLAKKLNVKNIFVKDESHRFGLNAFKALGGTFALAKILCGKLDVDISDASFEFFNKSEIHERIKNMVFITATDGNHGRGLAWAANKLGCHSVVYMPKGSSQFRLKAIQAFGANAYITDLNYDNSVRYAKEQAKINSWTFVQDTVLDGYIDIPNWITQGYMTMASEAYEQLRLEGYNRPTHILLQAGVGSMAGSVLGYFSNLFKEQCPKTIILEPKNANCIYKSALINDGNPHSVAGNLDTIMAGLACGEPNPVTWEILKDLAHAYISCPDYVSAQGMRILSSPIGEDKRIISGESGAVGIGLLSIILDDNNYLGLRKDLDIDENSVILCFNTEGNTDPNHYQEIIFKGKNPSY